MHARSMYLIALVIAFGVTASPAAPAPEQATPAATEARPAGETDAGLRDYYSANGLLNRGLYDLAAVEYREFLTAHPYSAEQPHPCPQSWSASQVRGSHPSRPVACSLVETGGVAAALALGSILASRCLVCFARSARTVPTMKNR